MNTIRDKYRQGINTMCLRVLDRTNAHQGRSPDILVETPFNSRTKLRTCIRIVQEFSKHDVRKLDIQVCRVSPDGRWVDTARAVPFFEFRKLVVDQWVFGCVRKGGLRCFFQPIVESTGRGCVGVYGHEALIRCRFSDDLTLTAGDLFSLAYSTRLKRELHAAAIWCCLRGSSRCQEAGKLFVNIDPCMVDTSGDFWNRVKNLLNENKFAFQNLVFEIVESDKARDIGEIGQFCNEARALGCRIALDDFGVQSDPFQLLFAIRPDIVKLESSLVRGCIQDPWKRTVVEHLTGLASDLSIQCVLEGIEDELEWNWAVQQHASLIQGYRFGRPSADPVAKIDPQKNRPGTPFFSGLQIPAGILTPQL